MKLGSFEGTPEELKDVCENHGFDASDFLNSPTRFQPKMWIIYLAILIFSILSVCIWTIEISSTLLKVLIILNLVIVIFITALVHLRFEKWFITVLSFLGGLIILSVSLGYVTPKDAINELKNTVIQNGKKE